MKQHAIIVDLDGTLCNIEHRIHHFNGPKKNWKAFFNEIPNDTLNEWCRELILAMNKTYKIIFVTGRPSDYMNTTKEWLNSHGLGEWSLYMRESGDFRPDHEVKEEIYKTFIEPNYSILFCVDDRQQVVDGWRRLGLVCLQCAKGDY